MNPRHPGQAPGVAAALHQPLVSLSPGWAVVDRDARPRWWQPEAAHRFPHHPTASVPRPGPSAINGAAARPGRPVRVCPLGQPNARPPSRSVEPKTGLVLSPQAAGLAYPNYAAGGSPRQQLAGPTTSSPWLQTRCSLPRPNVSPLSIQTILLLCAEVPSRAAPACAALRTCGPLARAPAAPPGCPIPRVDRPASLAGCLQVALRA